MTDLVLWLRTCTRFYPLTGMIPGEMTLLEGAAALAAKRAELPPQSPME